MKFYYGCIKIFMQILKCPPGHLTIFKSLNSYFEILPEKISILFAMWQIYHKRALYSQFTAKEAKIRNILSWLTADSRCCKRNACTCLLYLDKDETEALLAQFFQKQENKCNENYWFVRTSSNFSFVHKVAPLP